MSGVGLAAVPEGGRVDFAELRDDRRRRLFAAMAEHGLDALVLGRPADIAFASGARQLWTSGARPFGPGCVVVAATGRVHLLSVWDEGVPAEITHQDLYGLSWNPANLMADLRAIDGIGALRRVGTDGLSPGFTQFWKAIAPDAEIVDASAALRSARQVKSAAEVACIETAAAIAEAALSIMIASLHPGMNERQLRATYAEALASLGAPTPPSEAVALVAGGGAAAGDVVVLDPGAMYAGYEAGLGRTWVVPGAAADERTLGEARRTAELMDALVAACAVGATGADIRAAWRNAGGGDVTAPLVHGVGLGVEAPVISMQVGGAEQLRAGMVLSVRAQGAAPWFERDTVLVSDRGPRRLTVFGRHPMVAAGQPAR